MVQNYAFSKFLHALSLTRYLKLQKVDDTTLCDQVCQ